MIPENSEMLLIRTREWQDDVVNQTRARRRAKAKRRGSLLRRLARTYSRMLSILL